MNSFEWLGRNIVAWKCEATAKESTCRLLRGDQSNNRERVSPTLQREIFYRRNYQRTPFPKQQLAYVAYYYEYYFSREKKKVICWFPGSLTRSSSRPGPSIFKEPTKKLRTKPLAFCLMQQSPLVQKRKCHRVMIQTSKTIAFCSTDAKFNRGERGPTRPIVWGSGHWHWGHGLRSFGKIYCILIGIRTSLRPTISQSRML